MTQHGGDVTTNSSKQPLAIRAINRIGRGLQVVGISVPRLRPDQMITEAQRRAGLIDFGDPDFRLGLEQLAESLEREAHLSQIGRFAAKGILVDQLVNRLQLINYRKQRPEVARQRIQRPLFVLGLPRTGTTILHEMLAQDPHHRSPLSWEVARPIPPVRPETLDSDPRIAQVDKQFAQVEVLAPGFQAIHAMGARLPQECVSILASHFISDEYGATYYVPGYRRWCLDQDMTGAYRWHHDYLQHLQVDYARPRWVLKSPPHLAYLDRLLAQYPDAVVVWTHRNPMEVMASVSSLACTLHGAFSDHIDPVTTAQAEVEHFSTVFAHGMAQRDALPNSTDVFFDLSFHAIITDPVSAIERMYAHFGFELTAEARTRMQDYLRNRPREKHGTHRYSAVQFGLSEAKHGALFASYRERFSEFLGPRA